MHSPRVSELLILAASTALASGFAVGLARRLVGRRLLDVPNERSSHRIPTPRGGGIGIVAAFLLAAGVALEPRADSPLLPLAALAVGLSGLGLVDDARPLPTAPRLLAHVAAALAAIAFVGFESPFGLPLFGNATGALAAVLWTLWIAGFVNAYNFMDGIDGLAATQAIIAGAGWAALGAFAGHDEPLLIGAALAAAALGFLWHNRPPARIFMGDVGSMFLGFALAVIPLLEASRTPQSSVLGLLVVWPFVADTTFTLCRRVLNGENVTRPHRTHLYQRLVRTGSTHARVTALYAGLALLGVASALAWERASGVVQVACLCTLAVAFSALVVWTNARERRAVQSSGPALS